MSAEVFIRLASAGSIWGVLAVAGVLANVCLAACFLHRQYLNNRKDGEPFTSGSPSWKWPTVTTRSSGSALGDEDTDDALSLTQAFDHPNPTLQPSGIDTRARLLPAAPSLARRRAHPTSRTPRPTTSGRARPRGRAPPCTRRWPREQRLCTGRLAELNEHAPGHHVDLLAVHPVDPLGFLDPVGPGLEARACDHASRSRSRVRTTGVISPSAPFTAERARSTASLATQPVSWDSSTEFEHHAGEDLVRAPAETGVTDQPVMAVAAASAARMPSATAGAESAVRFECPVIPIRGEGVSPSCGQPS